MLYKTEDIYGENSKSFQKRLENNLKKINHNNSKELLICIINTEIESLENHYEKLLILRESVNFDTTLAIKVQERLKQKKDKKKRYLNELI